MEPMDPMDTGGAVMEIVHFTVQGGEEETFLVARPAMIEAMRAAHPGLLDATLVRMEDGRWMDLVRWRSRSEALAAAASFAEVPEAATWGALIADVASMEHGEIAHRAAAPA
jgi:hypothetical protein